MDRQKGKERKKRGGGEVLEAEFALSPSSTFGLQMVGLLSSITRSVRWQRVATSVRARRNKDEAARILPHPEPLIKLRRPQNQSKLGSSVWA